MPTVNINTNRDSHRKAEASYVAPQQNEEPSEQTSGSVLVDLRNEIKNDSISGDSWLQRWANALDPSRLDVDKKACLAVCQAMLEDATGDLLGSQTPIEDFLEKFLTSAMTKSLTIDQTRDLLDSYSEEFQVAVANARYMAAQYPDLVLGRTPSKPDQFEAA